MTFEDYSDYVIKFKKNILEILNDFKIKKIPLVLLLNYSPLINPREYSISSSFL